MKRITLIIAAGLLSLGFATANAQDQDDEAAASMAELLRLIEQGQARDSREARQREAAFAQNRNQQQSLLNQARAPGKHQCAARAALRGKPAAHHHCPPGP